jgi:hypothetical protein
MKKLFDIPIYALSPGELSHRVKQKIDKLKEYAAGTDPQTMDLIIDNETFPKHCWDYNHIVGYIKISATRQDIVFDLFLPKLEVERYVWYSPRKAFLRDVNANGTHFYIGNMKSNEDIQKATDDMLTWMIKDFLPKRYYVDRSSFDNLNRYLDYLGILKE